MQSDRPLVLPLRNSKSLLIVLVSTFLLCVSILVGFITVSLYSPIIFYSSQEHIDNPKSLDYFFLQTPPTQHSFSVEATLKKEMLVNITPSCDLLLTLVSLKSTNTLA